MQALPALIDRRELLRPWKLISFALGTTLMLIGVDVYRISDWDVGISLIMPALTYLTAPWVVRVLLLRHWRLWPEAAFWTWFTVDGVYWLYHTSFGNEMLRRENLLTSLPLYLFMGCIWLYRGDLRSLVHEIRSGGVAPATTVPPAAVARRPWASWRRMQLMAALSFIYMLAIEPFWIETTVHRLGRHGPDARAIRIVQLSDLHLSRPGWREAMVLERVRELRPDVIVLTGDTIDRADALPDVDRFLAALPQVPRFAILGNWEYGSGASLPDLLDICRRRGVVLLDNATALVATARGKLLLTGLDDAGKGNPDWPRALATRVAVPPGSIPTPAASALPRLVLQHTPIWRDELMRLLSNARPSDRPLAILAGHTHGGQGNAFGWTPLLPPGSGPYVAGWFKDDGGVPLYVSRGIGANILPLRFGARPEIALFLLTP